ncbi:transmembrane family of transporters domain-containing protein [Ditylenchus destructor]|uniref:Transmembrane family of transporters domain-containing protein n=1 Tax=Ditylenchus destructor TaxID=166010 RepID=A0AAD4MXD1_9BILA|nr:transmembrane family of transporters domain-containing protein [Ditylenchus destructor]
MCVTIVIMIDDSPEIFGYGSDVAVLFSQSSGSFLMSTVIFIGYTFYKKNRPTLNPSICLPAFFSGIIWSGGMDFWLLSATKISQAIAGPIVAIVVACVASSWSVFYFKEIDVSPLYWTNPTLRHDKDENDTAEN